MFVHYRTRGFVLKKENLGEADQLFTVFTKDFGKLEVLGRAVRKIKSKLRAGVELFYLSEIEFIQGKAYKTLTDAILIEKFKNLRKDLNKVSIVHKISEILDKLIKGQEKDEKIWQLLEDVFRKLDNCSLSIIHYSLTYYYFFWNLISILGYQPDFYNCVLCQKKLTPDIISFNSGRGGLICGQCQKGKKTDNIISPEAIKIIRITLKRDLAALEKLKIEQKDIDSLESFSQNYRNQILSQIE